MKTTYIDAILYVTSIMHLQILSPMLQIFGKYKELGAATPVCFTHLSGTFQT